MSVRLIKRRFPSGAIRLYLDVNVGGRRKKEALGLILDKDRLQNRETLRMAEAIRAQRELSLQEQIHGVIHTSRRKRSFFDYFEQLIQGKTSNHTQVSWRNALHHLKRYSRDDVFFGQLTREYFDGFKTYLLREVKLSPNSAQIYFSRVKSALNQAVRDNLVSTNPTAGISIKRIERIPTFLTIEDLTQLAKTPSSNGNIRNAFLFSCFTGLRYSDIVSLTWDQVQSGYLVITQQKTSAPERLPMSRQAVQLLKDQRNTPPSLRSKQQTAQNSVFSLPRQSVIDKGLKRWARTAGLSKSISMHVGRHTFATLSLTSGIDIYTTSKLLGHKNLHSTQMYANVIDEKKKRAVEMLPTISLG